MNSEERLDHLIFPLSSSNEDLETISADRFRLLFDVKKFEVRSEPVRDKGIDFYVELKRTKPNGGCYYLNFRFAVQLKATEKEFNPDGSISLQLQTSNINYLLNSGMPSYYVLYAKNTEVFYYESVNEFVRNISEKETDWNIQASHTLRLDRILNSQAIDQMYEETYKRGIFQRTVNERAIAYHLPVGNSDKIQIDAEFNITDDTQIRSVIEGTGFEKINDGKWTQVIDLHEQASGAVGSSGSYNVILGIAYYYAGQLTDALPFFKKAKILQNSMNNEQRNLAIYFEDLTKFSMGLLTTQEYEKRMGKFKELAPFGLYIHLENARNDYARTQDGKPGESYKKYVADLKIITNHPNADDSVRLAVQCEQVLVMGNEMNSNMIRNIALLNVMESQRGIVPAAVRLSVAQGLIDEKAAWIKHVIQVQQLATKQNNYFIYFSSIIHEVRVHYENIVDIIVFVEEEKSDSAAVKVPDKAPSMNTLLEKIRNAAVYFRQVCHIENLVVCLLYQYEILHLLNDHEQAQIVMADMKELIEANELGEKRDKLEEIKQKGTFCEQLRATKKSIFQNHEAGRAEWEELAMQMRQIDEIESLAAYDLPTDPLCIQVLPLGVFCFPSAEKNTIYKILRITKKAAAVFDKMFEVVVPIADILHDPVRKEGRVDASMFPKTLESMRRVHQVRKALFDHKFYRCSESIS